MKALLIDVNFTTGERAGGINPRRNKNMPCHPAWQDTDAGKEIRLVLDGNVEPYRNVEGITVLEGEKAIEAALAKHFPEKEAYKVTDPDLKRLSIEQAVAAGKLDTTSLPRDSVEKQDEQARLKQLYEVAETRGITKLVKKRPKPREVMRDENAQAPQRDR